MKSFFKVFIVALFLLLPNVGLCSSPDSAFTEETHAYIESFPFQYGSGSMEKKGHRRFKSNGKLEKSNYAPKEENKFDYSALAQFFKILMYVGIAIIVCFLLYIVLQYIPMGRSKGGVTSEDASEEDKTFASNSIYDHNFMKEISELARKGDYNGAIRLVYLYVLYGLNEGKAIDWVESKTPIEYYYELRRPKLKNAFFELTSTFLAVRYGNVEATSETFQRVNDLGMAIVKLVKPQTR